MNEINFIISVVCSYFNISKRDFQSRSRELTLVLARQMAYYFCRKYTRASLNKIGNAIGKKDHATVLHGVRKIKGYIEIEDNHNDFLVHLTECEAVIGEYFNDLTLSKKLRNYEDENNILRTKIILLKKKLIKLAAEKLSEPEIITMVDQETNDCMDLLTICEQ